MGKRRFFVEFFCCAESQRNPVAAAIAASSALRRSMTREVPHLAPGPSPTMAAPDNTG